MPGFGNAKMLRRTRRWGSLAAAAFLLLASPLLPGFAAAQSCSGDCNGDSRVDLDELVRSVNVALGSMSFEACAALDSDGRPGIGIADLTRAVGGAISGCQKTRGADAIEGAARSAKTNLDALPKFFVFNFARVGPGGSAAAAEALSAGGSGGPAPVPCSEGGDRTDVCRNDGDGSSTRETMFSNCIEKTFDDADMLFRDGTQRLSVATSGCPIRPPAGVPVTLVLEGYREVRSREGSDLRSLTVDGTLTESFDPQRVTCMVAGDTFQNGTLAIDGTLRLTCSPDQDPTCDPSLRDLLVTANGLEIEETFAEPACDRTLRATGQLIVRNDVAGEDFSQDLDGLSMAEVVDGNVRNVNLTGRVFVDCIGQVEFASRQPIASPADAFCPTSGALDVILQGSLAGSGAGNAGGQGGGAGGRSDLAPSASEGGLREYALRAANGQVYQVLQNPSGNTELGGEDMRITTLVGSTDPPCSSDSGSGAIAGVGRGLAFPPEDVRVSPLVPQAAAPCFNPNGTGGAGLVCIPDDGDCGDDCRCTGGGCLTFSIADGTPLEESLVAGQVVDLSEPCDTITAPSTFAFGTDSPTIRTEMCVPPPADGFTLAMGQSIIFAYDASPGIAFATATGGFSVDTDGQNTRCPGTGVLTGIAFKSELGPARVIFDGGSVAFDVNADRVLERELPNCQQLSLARCGAPTPTPTPRTGMQRCFDPRTVETPVAGSTQDRSNNVDGASCADGGNTSADLAFSFVPPTSGCYRIDTLETAGLAQPFDTLLYVRRGTDDCEGPELACNDNADATTLQSALFVQLTAGTPVAIVVDGIGTANGDFRLRVENRGANCSGATPTPTSTDTASQTPSPTATATSPSVGLSPLGRQFQVNSFTVEAQQYGTVAALTPSGGFVVVWQGGGAEDGSSEGIFGQRFAPEATGDEFPVNTYASGRQTNPSIAALSNGGRFVVAWDSIHDGFDKGVFAQLFTPTGTRRGAEFQVSLVTLDRQYDSSVAPLRDGGFVVVWVAQYQSFDFGVFAQRFDSNGNRLGAEFRVNSHTRGRQDNPAVAAAPDGSFVVAWESAEQDGSYEGVFAQRFANSGAPRGTEFQVNSHTAGVQRHPAVAVATDGTFVVAWDGNGEARDVIAPFAQRFDSTGNPSGAEFRVSAHTETPESLPPAVASTSDGGFVVVWSRLDPGLVPSIIVAQAFDASGSQLGPELRVNESTDGVQPRQYFPSIASDANDEFLVVWQGDELDGSEQGIFGRRLHLDR